MNLALLFKIPIITIIAYGYAKADDKFNSDAIIFFVKSVNDIVNSHALQTINPNYEEREAEKLRVDTKDGLIYLPIRRLWKKIDLERAEKKHREFVQSKLKEKKERMNRYRIKELVKFMQNHVESTKYLYGEVKRILRDRKVFDEMRKIIYAIEAKENATISNKMDHCYDEAILMAKKVDIWDEELNQPNNLDIRIIDLRDPLP